MGGDFCNAAIAGDARALKEALDAAGLAGRKFLGGEREAVAWALDMMASKGSREGVEALLRAGASRAMASKALLSAARGGHAQALAALLEHADAGDGQALWLAAARGSLECVKMLAKVCDPKAHKSSALKAAALRGHGECAAFLAPLSEVNIFDGQGRSLANLARAKGRVEIAQMLARVGASQAQSRQLDAVAAAGAVGSAARL